MFPGYGATPFPLPLSAFEPTFFESPLLFPNSSFPHHFAWPALAEATPL